jgi:hypothetical protein
MAINRSFLASVASGALGLWLSANGATEPLLLTQSPRPSSGKSGQSYLELLYPAGSRVVVVTPGASREVRVLSKDLFAAGDPVLSYDGRTAMFVGKMRPEGDWQIYRAQVGGGRCRVVTSMPGGAMDPALLPDGSTVFASPAPKVPGAPPPQLYVQPSGGKPRPLTFSPAGAFDPTVLPEGRILFVSTSPHDVSQGPLGLSLFTINNDGTEVAAYACQHDSPASIRRPRHVSNGLIGFLAGPLDGEPGDTSPEYVRTARPFLSRAKLFSDSSVAVRSVQPEGESNLLVCAKSSAGTWAVYRVNSQEALLGAPLFEDPKWDCIEALTLRSQPRPMGRLTSIDPTKSTGRILCLNINDTTYREGEQPSTATANRVRVLAQSASGTCRPLGEVSVQADGSFMAEVPADVPLGFEAINEQGTVVRRVAPMIWVRPGENRSCVGCHAPHNRVPHNHRPEAVRSPVPLLSLVPELKFSQVAP